jgi:hypothetical protein
LAAFVVLSVPFNRPPRATLMDGRGFQRSTAVPLIAIVNHCTRQICNAVSVAVAITK